MTTVVNSPAATEERTGASFLVGMIVLLLFFFLFFVYGLPALNRAAQQSPAAPSDINVDIPDKIDVNVDQQQPQQ